MLAIAIVFNFHVGAAMAVGSGLVYDKNDSKLAATAVKASDSQGINSVAEAAQAAVALASKPGVGSLNPLILAGHGSPGLIGLGSGTSSVYQKGKDLQNGKLGDVRSELATMKSSLDADGYVILSGCETGQGAAGLSLVKELSTEFSSANAMVFANTKCIGLSANYGTGSSVCSVEGNTLWQQSSVIAAKKGNQVTVDRTLMKTLTPKLCVPKK
ncbi:hypothetical protein LYNGBM3L_49480 [Moorena producens 3L]|uniref:DUF4347 domain-containing protein n=2 Tax=Coleofasciculaceae TaxID=1892251 RepID=F4XXX7_9CYAN|nr:hypothetical protein LYNGBM3L_49480 [Moorena producens 3L]